MQALAHDGKNRKNDKTFECAGACDTHPCNQNFLAFAKFLPAKYVWKCPAFAKFLPGNYVTRLSKHCYDFFLSFHFSSLSLVFSSVFDNMSSPSPSHVSPLVSWIELTAQAFVAFRQDNTTSLSLPTLPAETSEAMVIDYFKTLPQPARFLATVQDYTEDNGKKREFSHDLSALDVSREIVAQDERRKELDLALRQNVWEFLILRAQGNLFFFATVKFIYVVNRRLW